MVVILQAVIQPRDSDGTEASLYKGRAVGPAAQGRHPAAPAGNAQLCGGGEEQFAHGFVRPDGSVEVPLVGHEIKRVMDGVEGVDEGGHVAVLLAVRPAPGFRPAQAAFLRARQENADLGMFEYDAALFHGPQQGDSHEAAAEVVVGAVHDKVFVPQEGQAEPEGEEDQTEQPGCAQPPARAAEPADRQRDVVQHPDGGADAVRLEHKASEAVVQRPFPGRVNVAVEEHSAAALARAWPDGGHIRAFAQGKEAVHHLMIQDKLEQHQEKGQNAGENAERREKEERGAAEDVQDSRKIQIAVEAARMLVKGLDADVRAAALFPQDVRHIFRSLPLAFAAGAALFHAAADMGDLLHHVGDGLPAAGNQRIQSHGCSFHPEAL